MFVGYLFHINIAVDQYPMMCNIIGVRVCMEGGG